MIRSARRFHFRTLNNKTEVFVQTTNAPSGEWLLVVDYTESPPQEFIPDNASYGPVVCVHADRTATVSVINERSRHQPQPLTANP